MGGKRGRSIEPSGRVPPAPPCDVLDSVRLGTPRSARLPSGSRFAAPGLPVGILALQGDFARHADALARAGLESREIRRPEELGSVSGLVLPGGESTTLLKFFEREGWDAPLLAFAASGKPILATCAGLILVARKVENPEQRSLQLIDVDVVRNAYGRQVDSFIGEARSPGGEEMEAVYIRAPKISRVGPEVEVLATQGEDPVWVKQGNVQAATFHPELSSSPEVHRRAFCS